MTAATNPRNTRILLIDDTAQIHEDFRQILAGITHADGLDELEATVLGVPAAPRTRPTFELTSAFQGAEGLDLVRRSVGAGTPYAVVFIDVRMPPGWDGIETLARIWQVDPAVQAVLCSAYNDYSWDRVVARLGVTDRLLILKKPCELVEILQTASALTEKWNQQAELREAQARTRALLEAVPDTILRVALDGTCLDYKPSGERSSRRFDRCVGKSLHDVLPADAARRLMDCARRAVAGGGTQSLDVQQREADEVREFEARVTGSGATEFVAILRDVTARRRAEQERRAQEETIRSQTEALVALSTPLIPISKHVVVMPLVGPMTRERASQLREALCRGIADLQPQVAILDLTGISRVEPEIAAELLRVAAAVRLLGAELVITGIQPDLATLLAALDVDLSGLRTLDTLQGGIAYAMRRR